jgi:hypothetical protein
VSATRRISFGAWAVTVLAVTVTGCAPAFSTGLVAEQEPLPTTWVAIDDSYHPGEPPAELPTITLNPDGTAVVANLPMGEV